MGGFVFVKKFLITDKPKLKKSDLFEVSSDRLKNTAQKFSDKPAPPKNITKPVKLPKQDDDKSKHFEVRV